MRLLLSRLAKHSVILSAKDPAMQNLRLFLPVAALSVFVLTPSRGPEAQAPRYELLIKGGHVIDPANHIDGVTDVAVSGGKIVAVEKDIPASAAGKVVD